MVERPNQRDHERSRGWEDVVPVELDRRVCAVLGCELESVATDEEVE